MDEVSLLEIVLVPVDNIEDNNDNHSRLYNDETDKTKYSLKE